jgi:dipeptidyl aminopeptidase/acylaminoacyl peptidase
VRHADLEVAPDGVLAVRETHPAGGRPADVVNELVRVAPDGTTQVLVTGPDFVSDPRPPPDGSLAWLQSDHPHMPWDAARLVVRAADGAETVVAGGPGESVVQPVWDADGSLWFLCDRTNFWSLYRWRPGDEAQLVLDVGSDIAGPQWVFGQSRFAPLPDGRIVLAYGRGGADRLAVLDRDGGLRELDLPYGTFRYVTAHGTSVVCVAGSPSSEPVVLRVDVDGGGVGGPGTAVLRAARDLGLDPAWFARPEHVTFPTEHRGTGIGEAHALVYPPTNPEASAPAGVPTIQMQGRRAPRCTRSARRSTTWTPSTPRWRCSRATRTRWCRRPRPRRSSPHC